MKHLKIYESYSQSLAEELVDELSQDTIEAYFDDNKENSDYDIEEIIGWWPQLVWRFIDDDKYIEDFIKDEVQNLALEDFDDDDEFREFIEDNMTTDKENKIIQLYKDNQYDDKLLNDKVSKIDGIVSISPAKKTDDKIIRITSTEGKVKKYRIPENHEILVNEGDTIRNGTTLSTLKYDDEMLSELNTQELKEVIEEDNESGEFVESIIKQKYDREDAESVITSLYGKLEGEELYNIVKWYIDDDKIIEDYRDNEDFDTKKTFVTDHIEKDTDLQRKILEKNKANVLKLAELFTQSTSNENISDEYEFQKLYIKEYVKENKGDDKKGTLKAKALKFIFDYLELDPQIEEEYKKYMWMILADKYNI